MTNYSFLLANAHSRYQIYASQFIEIRKAIETVRETFAQEQIWKDQCDYVIHKMNPLKNAANTIAKLIQKQDRKSTGRNHYPLLVNAYYFTDQVDILIDCIREYREITDQRSSRKLKQKLIVTSLHGVESSLQELMKELDKAMMNSKPM